MHKLSSYLHTSLRTTTAWLIALLLFFPIFWLALMAFKTEQQAIASPPLLFFTPTLESFAHAVETTSY